MLECHLKKKWQRKKLGSNNKDMVKIVASNGEQDKEERDFGEISKYALCQVSDVFRAMIGR